MFWGQSLPVPPVCRDLAVLGFADPCLSPGRWGGVWKTKGTCSHLPILSLFLLGALTSWRDEPITGNSGKATTARGLSATSNAWQGCIPALFPPWDLSAVTRMLIQGEEHCKVQKRVGEIMPALRAGTVSL